LRQRIGCNANAEHKGGGGGAPERVGSALDSQNAARYPSHTRQPAGPAIAQGDVRAHHNVAHRPGVGISTSPLRPAPARRSGPRSAHVGLAQLDRPGVRPGMKRARCRQARGRKGRRGWITRPGLAPATGRPGELNWPARGWRRCAATWRTSGGTARHRAGWVPVARPWRRCPTAA
jgi:hypothetical protein